MRDAKLCLAERSYFVFLYFLLRKIKPRAHKEILEVALRYNGSYGCKFECADPRGIIGVVIVRRHGNLGRKPPSSSEIEAVQAKITCGVGPPPPPPKPPRARGAG